MNADRRFGKDESHSPTQTQKSMVPQERGMAANKCSLHAEVFSLGEALQDWGVYGVCGGAQFNHEYVFD